MYPAPRSGGRWQSLEQRRNKKNESRKAKARGLEQQHVVGFFISYSCHGGCLCHSSRTQFGLFFYCQNLFFLPPLIIKPWSGIRRERCGTVAQKLKKSLWVHCSHTVRHTICGTARGWIAEVDAEQLFAMSLLPVARGKQARDSRIRAIRHDGGKVERRRVRESHHNERRRRQSGVTEIL